ncbi:MAG: hypothetical protein QOK35_1011 [Pseudonocardiales bacterium]|nr:hypothetical protein [Pseudonocardiales bacterium]
MVRSSRLAHDGSTLLSWLSDPGNSRTPLTLGWCLPSCAASLSSGRRGVMPACRKDRTRSTSSGPGARSARGNADRRSARVRHSGAGCSHAPRPGSRRRGSGVSTPSTATTRNRSSAGARVRQPTQVRTGPWPIGDRTGTAGRRAGFRPGRRTGFECTASPVSGTPHRGLALHRPARSAAYRCPRHRRRRANRGPPRRGIRGPPLRGTRGPPRCRTRGPPR